MRYYVVELTFTAPLEKIDAAIEEHRALLRDGYDRGWLLMSGPKKPRTGGIIVARMPSLEALRAFLSRDPYRTHNLADCRIVEFFPVGRAPLLEGWING